VSRFDFKSAGDISRTSANAFRLLETVLSGFQRLTAGHQFTRSRNFRTITASAAHIDGDDYILVDASSAAVTYTLPRAVAGVELDIKKIDSTANLLTIDGNGSETIDGATTATLSSQYDSVTVASDGTAWHIVVLALLLPLLGGI